MRLVQINVSPTREIEYKKMSIFKEYLAKMYYMHQNKAYLLTSTLHPQFKQKMQAVMAKL